MRGEKAPWKDEKAIDEGSPPLARGKAVVEALNAFLARITPACAGKSKLRIYIHLIFKDHPRLRGEKSLKGVLKCLLLGSPPLARGKDDNKPKKEHFHGITPACAGKR